VIASLGVPRLRTGASMPTLVAQHIARSNSVNRAVTGREPIG
jgi:hypothetical protein